ncbi:hypothetical protein ACIQWR_07590 [Streptomyces sp. NPDC098789]|uniref:hypothetical protein n=1 Tax=Streptomyces sp. NPDC098789 TaxID=3366098 RepID=UPI003828B54A
MQDNAARRTVDELVTLYDLEPDVRDIFVEGRSDRNFLASHLAPELESNPCRVYAISDRVCVSDGDLLKAGLPTGERGRIIWLARQLADRLPGNTSAALVADKDFASLGADAHDDIHGLLYTDYSSIEAYALNETTLGKLLRVTFGAPDDITGSTLLSRITPALVSLFVIRLCLRDSGCGATLTVKLLSKWELGDQSQGRVRETFKACLHALPPSERNGHTDESLHVRYLEHLERVDSEFRNFVNGHDVSKMLVRFLKIACPSVFNSSARRPFQDPEVLETVLMSTIETSHIAHEGLFRALRVWLQGTAEAAELHAHEPHLE